MAATRSKDNRPGIASRMASGWKNVPRAEALTVRRGRRRGPCRLDGLKCQILPQHLEVGAERRGPLRCDPEPDLEAARREHPPPTDVPRFLEALRVGVQIAVRQAERVPRPSERGGAVPEEEGHDPEAGRLMGDGGQGRERPATPGPPASWSEKIPRRTGRTPSAPGRSACTIDEARG